MLKANKSGFFPYTPATNLLYGLREALRMLHEEGFENVLAAPHAARRGDARCRARVGTGHRPRRSIGILGIADGGLHARRAQRRPAATDHPRALRHVAWNRTREAGRARLPHRTSGIVQRSRCWRARLAASRWVSGLQVCPTRPVACRLRWNRLRACRRPSGGASWAVRTLLLSSHGKPIRYLRTRRRARQRAPAVVRGEVRFDRGSRALDATDASNYRQVPHRRWSCHVTKKTCGAAVAVCTSFGAPILARGSGTSLAGQSCNVAVVLDFTKS